MQVARTYVSICQPNVCISFLQKYTSTHSRCIVQVLDVDNSGWLCQTLLLTCCLWHRKLFLSTATILKIEIWSKYNLARLTRERDNYNICVKVY